MIDEEITFMEKGYYSTDLSHGSSKPVWAICEGEDCQREGGRGRWVVFMHYRDLCFLCAQKVRHVLKDEDKIGKRDYIDDEITFADKGYRSTELKPNSHKEVWAICTNPDCEREGGRGRWVMFFQCRELCRSCAMKNRIIPKCETPTEKLKCIDDDITYAEKGYRSTDLSYGSQKPVFAICQGENCQREGGRGRWVVFSRCSDLCLLCANIMEGARRKNNGSMKGEKNCNWKGGITPEDRMFRASCEYTEWRISVFERDDYTCQECGQHGGNLNAHHILPYRDYKDPEYSLNIDNGITLCEECHDKVFWKEYEFVDRYQKIVNEKKYTVS